MYFYVLFGHYMLLYGCYMVIICDYPLSKCTFGYFNLLDGATFGWIVLNSLATNGDFVARLLAFSEVVKSSCFFLQKREINVGKSTTTDQYCNVFFQGNWVSHLFKWANWFSQINHFFCLIFAKHVQPNSHQSSANSCPAGRKSLDTIEPNKLRVRLPTHG